jgi:hypothetical protein
MRGSVSSTPMSILAPDNRAPEMSVRARRRTGRRWGWPLAFVDVNNDTFPDLILGQSNPNRDSHVLVNDGTGYFSQIGFICLTLIWMVILTSWRPQWESKNHYSISTTAMAFSIH